jgi:hypothetical protein
MPRETGKKSLQDVLRARRGATPLVSRAEAANREASRRRAEIEAAATAAVERWRSGKSVDGRAKLPPEVYVEVFARSPAAYRESAHWVRKTRAQLALAPRCEVTRCGKDAGVAAYHLHHDTLGGEQPGVDLITLCPGCHRRVERLGRQLARVPSRAEIAGLDPSAPRYERADIAALRAKYGE